MNRIAALIISAAFFSGCVPIETGGVGETSSGKPISGLMSLDQATGIFTVTIESPRGWSCASTFKKSGQNLQKRTVPLSCNDGRKGNLIMTANQYQGQAVGTFALTDGETGQVTFGHL